LAPRFVVAGDLDRDGRTDLIAANHTSYDFTFFFNEGRVGSAPSPLQYICTELDFSRLTRTLPATEVAELELRYITPAGGGNPSLLPTTFWPTSGDREPWEELAAYFPDRFQGLSEAEYLDLVARRATREYVSGSILRLRLPGRVAYGFTVFMLGADPLERVTVSEAASAFHALDAAFDLAPFAYTPDTAEARSDARNWGDAGFPILVRDPPIPVRRGDAQADGVVNLTDVVTVLDYLFRNGPSLPCSDAADANDDGAVDVSDAVALLFHLFASQGPLPPPSTSCGMDPTDDDLPCGTFPPCG
jgi:hypothetical protein